MTWRLPQEAKAWLIAAIVVLAGWVSGYFVWGTNGPGFKSFFTLHEPAVMTAIGLPACLVAAVLRRSQSRRRYVVGTIVLVVGVAVLAYLASLSFFGGICLDPGDVCVTSWPSRLTALAIASLYVGGGLGVELVGRAMPGPSSSGATEGR